jgi:hypothetical protein
MDYINKPFLKLENKYDISCTSLASLANIHRTLDEGRNTVHIFKRTGRGSAVCTYYAYTGRKWLVNQAHSTQSRKEGSEGEGEDAGYMVWLVAAL